MQYLSTDLNNNVFLIWTWLLFKRKYIKYLKYHIIRETVNNDNEHTPIVTHFTASAAHVLLQILRVYRIVNPVSPASSRAPIICVQLFFFYVLKKTALLTSPLSSYPLIVSFKIVHYKWKRLRDCKHCNF